MKTLLKRFHLNHLVQNNKQYRMKVLLYDFLFNGRLRPNVNKAKNNSFMKGRIFACCKLNGAKNKINCLCAKATK